MSGRTAEGGAARSAAELARAFDRSFAEPAHATAEDIERLLAIRVGGEGYAVRLRDVSGLVVDRKIVPLPSPTPALMGIVGLRSGLAPAYSLSVLLGYGTDAEPPRWLLLVGLGPLFGLACEAFEGHRQVPRADVSSSQRDRAELESSVSVPESVRVDDGRRGLISIAALTEIIRANAASVGNVGNVESNDRTKEK